MTPGSCPSDTSAHPRSRGENRPGGKPQLSTQGSSPLTRGKRSHHGGYDKRRGLIPAHAGKTTGRATVSTVATAHPRSRGENLRSCRPGSKSPGSSPLTRGKPFSSGSVAEQRRLIPAHAGKTFGGVLARCCVRAHPRSRGENEHPPTLTCRPGGSSPLTRGKRFEGLAVDGRAGLIPAHAGKTASLKWRSLPTAAHPRSRGENRFHDRCRGHADWLIPAHAGKTAGGPAAWRA